MSWSSEELLEGFRSLDACLVSDAADATGIGAAITGLRPMWQGARAVGRAVTMRLVPGDHYDGPRVHLGVRAIEAACPGDVIVVDNAGRTEMGSWGGLLSRAASTAAIAGVVSDGAVRDVDEACQLAFPLFALTATPRTARGRVVEESCGERIEIAGVAVDPGDVIVADGSGVVVIPSGGAEEVLARALELARKEQAMADLLDQGLRPSEVLGASYESMLASGQAAAGGGAAPGGAAAAGGGARR